MRETKDAAFRILDVFAENDAVGVALRPRRKRLVHGVADAVFAGGQDFVVQLRQLAGDLQFQFIRARILGAIGLGELGRERAL